jgi:hypothetical protein
LGRPLQGADAPKIGNPGKRTAFAFALPSGPNPASFRAWQCPAGSSKRSKQAVVHNSWQQTGVHDFGAKRNHGQVSASPTLSISHPALLDANHRTPSPNPCPKLSINPETWRGLVIKQVILKEDL